MRRSLAPVAALGLTVVCASQAWAAADVRRFDLACRGHVVTTGQRGRFEKMQSTLASVNLVSMRFCWRPGPCRLLSVRSASPERIVLRDEHTVQGSLVYVVRPPRDTYSSDIVIRLKPPPDVVGHEEGSCKRLPFTPF